jgi:hypothetical protein
MIYTHVLNKGGRGVSSPLDRTEEPAAVYVTIGAARPPDAGAYTYSRVTAISRITASGV